MKSFDDDDKTDCTDESSEAMNAMSIAGATTASKLFDNMCRALSRLRFHHKAKVDYVYISLLYVLRHWNDPIGNGSNAYIKLVGEIKAVIQDAFPSFVKERVSLCGAWLHAPDSPLAAKVEGMLQVLQCPLAIGLQFIVDNEVTYNFVFIRDLFSHTCCVEADIIPCGSEFAEPVALDDPHPKRLARMLENAEYAISNKKRCLPICC